MPKRRQPLPQRELTDREVMSKLARDFQRCRADVLNLKLAVVALLADVVRLQQQITEPADH